MPAAHALGFSIDSWKAAAAAPEPFCWHSAYRRTREGRAKALQDAWLPFEPNFSIHMQVARAPGVTDMDGHAGLKRFNVGGAAETHRYVCTSVVSTTLVQV